MTNEITVLKKACAKVEKYLQCECSDFWHCKILDNKIHAYWNDHRGFILECDDGDWYISGNDIGIDMIAEIHKILEKIEDRQEQNTKLKNQEEKYTFFVPNINGFADFISYHANYNKPIYFVNGHVTAGFCLNTRLNQKYNFFSDEVVGEINEAICKNMYMFDVVKTNKFYSCNDNMFSRDNSAKNIEGLLLTVKEQYR